MQGKVQEFMKLLKQDFASLAEHKHMKSDKSVSAAAMCDAEKEISPKLRSKLEKHTPDLAKAVTGFSDAVATTLGEADDEYQAAMVSEELRYVVGTVLAVASGTSRTNIQPNPKTFMPTVEFSIQLVPVGQTQAWLDALASGCGETGKGEL